jgi:glycosyltransferase involved in cell wall biosynthesis
VILKKVSRYFYYLYFNRFIKNVFRTNYNKKVLISYITKPFKKENKGHTNNFEVLSAAKIFHELGYQVDVMHYESTPPKLDGYNVIYGFGDVFRSYFESRLLGKKTIHYGTGMHVTHQNTATLNRLKYVYKKKGVWLGKSARFVEKTRSHQTCLVDTIIALGDSHCQNTFKNYYDGSVVSLLAPYYQVLNAEEVMSKRHKSSRENFLWFGSSGLVHKGLDLCLEYFVTRPDLTLHICGDITSEPDFAKAFFEELYHRENIVVHGFIDIESDKFKDVLSLCAFNIFPSCSEGGSPSVMTVVGNGALIPIITREASASTGFAILIKSFDFSGIEEAVLKVESLSDDELIELQYKNLEFVQKNNSQSKYYANLKTIIERIVFDEDGH